MMTEVAITLYLFIGFIAAVIYFLVKINLEDIPAEKKFKKIYRKKKDRSDFFLCDYCIRCKAKYTCTGHFERRITRYVLLDDCPFIGKDVESIKACSKFELDKNKI